MHDIQLMKVRNTTNDVLEESTSLNFINFGASDDIVKQLAILNVFHDEKEMLGSLYNFIELNNAWMSD